jgi:hypothetical protein
MLKIVCPDGHKGRSGFWGRSGGYRSDRASLAPFRTHCLTYYFRAALEKAGFARIRA